MIPHTYILYSSGRLKDCVLYCICIVLYYIVAWWWSSGLFIASGWMLKAWNTCTLHLSHASQLFPRRGSPIFQGVIRKLEEREGREVEWNGMGWDGTMQGPWLFTCMHACMPFMPIRRWLVAAGIVICVCAGWVGGYVVCGTWIFPGWCWCAFWGFLFLDFYFFLPPRIDLLLGVFYIYIWDGDAAGFLGVFDFDV